MKSSYSMKVQHIDARDLPEAWFLCLRSALMEGYEYVVERGSYEGTKRKELDLAVVQVRYPERLPLIPSTPPGIPSPTDMEYVQDYMRYLMTDHKEDKEQYTYGEDLAPQIPKVIEMYKKDGLETNQAFMAVGDRYSIDLPDPQCLRGVDTRVRYGALHFIVYFRSWDLWGGFPPNLAGLQLVKDYMAAEIGVQDGELIAISKGLHLYEYAWDLAKSVVHLG